MDDSRFKHIATDPKFRRIPKGTQKVKIDKRFKSMFDDKKFKIKYTVDKRGRPINVTSTEDLRRYYELSSENESSSEEPENEKSPKMSENDLEESAHEIELHRSGEKNKKSKKVVRQKKGKKLKSTLIELESNSVSEEIKNNLKNLSIDYARGEAPIISESSSDDEEIEDELSESEQIEHKWGELDADADQTEITTHRLAACNMDWDRIRAVDLMVLFNSFLPSGGVMKSVAIYPSEFGKQRMKEEEIKGPIELTKAKSTDESKSENKEGSQYHMEKLRQYQLNRLKYYYAVLIFDKPESANKVYTECDGMEYESSAIKLDLRFIPDDVIFEEEPKSFCDKLPEVNKYQPRFFATTALQQVKVDLTWDETNPERIEITEKLNSGKVDDISEVDLQNYLASSSEEEVESDNDNGSECDTESKADIIDKYKALLQNIEENEEDKNKQDVELEISWGINLKEKTEELVKQKQISGGDTTPFQKYLDKRKERQKEKRKLRKSQIHEENPDHDSDVPSDIDMNDPYFAEEFRTPEFKSRKSKKDIKKCEVRKDDDEEKAELELLLNEEDNRTHFNLKNIQDMELKNKKKKKKAKEQVKDNFEIDVGDERFSALFTSHHYNIDPTDSHYKKTKAMDALINEKLKRRVEDSIQRGSETTVKKMRNGNINNAGLKKSELNMLIKSVKRKTTGFKNKEFI